MSVASITIPLEIELTPRSKALLAFFRSLERPAEQPAPDMPATSTDAPVPPGHGEYWAGQGGIYICTLPALMGVPARHLIAGVGQSDCLAFGPLTDVSGADSHIDGRANTTALLAHSERHPAAEWARAYTADGHADFFLPARLDLVMAHICARSKFDKAGWYWSSTQNSRNDAFVQDFEGGNSGWNDEDDEHRVRAFRWIQLDHLNA